MTVQTPSPAAAQNADNALGRLGLDALCFAPIAIVTQHLADGSISAVALCLHMLTRIHDLDLSLGAYSQVLAETALAEAAAADERRKAGVVIGPLDGIPIAVKDLIDTRPAVCKAGLAHLADYVPAADAAVVAALRRAGAVMIGVTETDPGAFSTATPQTINPLDPRRTAGGSSGGSAAAVAAGLACAAIGTDTGGSIRIPAACCSIFGFKPSWGRVDMTGARPLAPSLDHLGSLTRSVADLTLLQSVLDPALGADVDRERRWTIGTSADYFKDAAPVVQSSFAAIIDDLRSKNVTLRSVALPCPGDVLAFHMVNLPKEAADYHTSKFPDAWPDYPEIARSTVEAGSRTSVEDYALSEDRRAHAIAMVDDALAEVDALILPTMPLDAPARDQHQVQVGRRNLTTLEATIWYTALFNQTGHPVVTLPAVLLADGRALSIQLVGKRDDDACLLALAKSIEQCLAVRVDYASMVERQKSSVQRVRAEIP